MVNWVRPMLMTGPAPVTMDIDSQRGAGMTVVDLPQAALEGPF